MLERQQVHLIITVAGARSDEVRNVLLERQHCHLIISCAGLSLR